MYDLKTFFEINKLEISDEDLQVLDQLSKRQKGKLIIDLKDCEFRETNTQAEEYLNGNISAVELYNSYRG